jgi:hypothetical protein
MFQKKCSFQLDYSFENLWKAPNIALQRKKLCNLV